MIAIFAIFALMLYAHIVNYARHRAKKRNDKNFRKFEALLLDPETTGNSSRFFTGETILQSEATIYLPDCDESETFVTELTKSLEERLQTISLGFVIRSYPYIGGTGVDLQLFDFVKGIDAVRKTLLDYEAPQETFIEYETGEFRLYE